MNLIILLLFVSFLYPVRAHGLVGFTAGAETGSNSEWTAGGRGSVFYPDEFFASQVIKRTGAWSFRAENMPPSVNDNAKVLRWGLFNQLGLGIGDNYYYRAYYYIESGYNDTTWKNNMQWKLYPSDQNGVSGCGLPFRLGFQRVGSAVATREVVLIHHACQQYAEPDCVDVAGDKPGTPGGVYRAITPTAIPDDTWFEIQVFYKPAFTNGQIIVWQNGTQILNITHPNLDTLTGKPGCNNQRLYWGVGSYTSPQATGTQRVYIDDVRVADQFIEDPSQPTTVASQTACRFESATGTEAAPDTIEGSSITMTAGECRRVRCAVDVTVATSDAANYGLYFSTTGADGTFTAIPSVCTTAAPCFNSASFPNLTHNQVTTDAGLSAATFVAGKVQLIASDVAVGSIPAGSGTEVVAGVCTDAEAAGTYHFRFRRNGEDLNAATPYVVTPDFTLQSPEDPQTPLTGGLSVGGGTSAGGVR